jgi:hypothetical protein
MHRKKKQSERKTGQVAGDVEGHLFRRVMADAKPLRTDTVELPQRRPRAAARFSRLDEGAVLRESLETPPHDVEIANGGVLLYRHPSVTRKTLRRLARGGVSIQGEVDLHGLNSAEAKQALKDFIEHSRVRGHTWGPGAETQGRPLAETLGAGAGIRIRAPDGWWNRRRIRAAEKNHITACS